MGAAYDHLELSASCNLPSVISRQWFQTADLLSAFVKPDGRPIGRYARSSRDADLREALLNGRVKVLTKPTVSIGIIRRRLRIRLISIISRAKIGR